jgi:hypothetical protein
MLLIKQFIQFNPGCQHFIIRATAGFVKSHQLPTFSRNFCFEDFEFVRIGRHESFLGPTGFPSAVFILGYVNLTFKTLRPCASAGDNKIDLSCRLPAPNLGMGVT